MMKWVTKQQGFSIIEVILVIMILAISVPPLLSLFTHNLTKSVDSEFYTKATLYAEEKMEEILADKRAINAGRGFGYILQAGRYPTDMPETGYARAVVIDTVGRAYEGVRYAIIQVLVTTPKSDHVVLNSWVTDYE